MGQIIEVRMPKYPECWDSCGNCRTGEVIVESLLVRSGELVRRDDTLLVLETGKVALDIPCPQSGTIVEVMVDEGDPIDEGALIALLQVE